MKNRFEDVHRFHFVGIKGVAMTALAVYFQERGMTVTGSDTKEVFPTDEILAARGIVPAIGFAPDHIEGDPRPDIVIYTGAHGGRSNIEVETAVNLGIPAYPHGKALGLVMEKNKQIIVAGSHGKTTTSAMIATLLSGAGTDPSYAVGCGGITGLGAPGHFGKSEWFVAEGDEYITDPGHDTTPRFLWTAPDILVVTNIDFDHPDVYPDIAAVGEAFRQLQARQTGIKLTVVNSDDPASHVLSGGKNVITYGFSPDADVRIGGVSHAHQETRFTLFAKGKNSDEFIIRVPGRHNILNATAAIVAAGAAGLSPDAIRKGLVTFSGTKRRFEPLGHVGGVTYFDDYAHHPAEIQATLLAARQWYPKARIITVFQPHTYSRTKSLMNDFAVAFGDTDILILTEIYASAREHDTLGVTGAMLAQNVRGYHAHVHFAPGLSDVRRILRDTVKPGDIVLCMGAGDIYSWEKEILKPNSTS